MNNQEKEKSPKSKWLVVLYPLVGILAVIWFLIRVLPKPARAAYPCQRVAAGIGGGFLSYALAAIVGGSLLHRFGRYIHRFRTAFVIILGGAFLGIALSIMASQGIFRPAAPAYTPSDGANNPMGTAKGIFPGRVVWVRDTNATSWDGSTGYWWSDAHTNQYVVSSMLSRSLQQLTGKTTAKAAWDALFKHYNVNHGRGNVGYTAGEKIVIKINCNQDFGDAWDNGGYNSPHLVYALVKHLIEVVGVAGANITVTDTSRWIGDPIYNKIRSNPASHFQAVRIEAGWEDSGRVSTEPNLSHPIHFVKPYAGDTDIADHYPPTSYTQATYLINLALLRGHDMFGITLSGKNFFGSVSDGYGFGPGRLHGSAVNNSTPNRLGMPHCHPCLLGHPQLGGKTMLFMLDGLYTDVTEGSKYIVRWQTLGNDWCSSLLVSQDPVALDSVGLDFLRNEPNMVNSEMTIHACNYLHESARANNPPSGAFYDPDNNGTRLASLGVHEHWNNATQRQYTRNLGTGTGIELLQSSPAINVVTPNGGEKLNLGSAYRVCWEATGITGLLRLNVVKDGVVIGIISENIAPLSGSYLWTVGSCLSGAVGVDPAYRVRIKVQGSTLYDNSNNTFAVIDLRVLSPNGGETWATGSYMPITWQADGLTTNVKLLLYRNGAYLGLVADNLNPATGSYNWHVGYYNGTTVAPAGSGYSIRVRDISSTAYDNSNTTFTLN